MNSEFHQLERDLKFAPYVAAICTFALCVTGWISGVVVPALALGASLGILQFAGALRSWKTKSRFASGVTSVAGGAVLFGVAAIAATGRLRWTTYVELVACDGIFMWVPMSIWRTRIREWLGAATS